MLKIKNILKISLPVMAMSVGIAHADVALQLTTPLTVLQEVGPIHLGTPANAGGQATFNYDKTTHILSYSIRFANLSGAPTMAHFHLGPKGSAGPVIQMICGGGMAATCPAQNSGQVAGTWQVPDQYVQPLLSGGVFVNFHTDLNPAGEIRGQISQ